MLAVLCLNFPPDGVVVSKDVAILGYDVDLWFKR